MNDYCKGIAWATGSISEDHGKRFLFVRNLDKFYLDTIAAEFGATVYTPSSKWQLQRDGRPQYAVKLRAVDSMPDFRSIQNVNDFCRAYVEIHGIIDLHRFRTRKGELSAKPRLRIYGQPNILEFINDEFPAGKKKIQSINNQMTGGCIGSTCAINFQSPAEIIDILKWVDGTPKNAQIWTKWSSVLQAFDETCWKSL